MSLGPIAPPSGGLGVAANAATATPNSPLPSPAATANILPEVVGAIIGSLEATLSAIAGDAAATQDSLAPLLANLTAAAASPALPPAARATVQQILTAQTPLDGAVDADSLRAAISNSGLFLEATLAAAVQANAVAPPDVSTDMKAMLLTLSVNLGAAAQTQAAAQQSAASQPPRGAAQPRRGATRPPPPVEGGATTGQPPARSSLEPDADPETLSRTLSQDTHAALDRLQLSQFASLPRAGEATRWAFELPVATTAGTAIAQFEISRDGRGPGGTQGAEPTWRARFSMNVEPSGPVHAEVTLSGGRTRVTLWAEREDARQSLGARQDQLTSALSGPDGADAAVRILSGAPDAPAPQAGRFVDRTS